MAYVESHVGLDLEDSGTQNKSSKILNVKKHKVDDSFD